MADKDSESVSGWEEWGRLGVEQGVFMKVVTTCKGGVTKLVWWVGRCIYHSPHSTIMCHIMFPSMVDCIYDGGPIRF